MSYVGLLALRLLRRVGNGLRGHPRRGARAALAEEAAAVAGASAPVASASRRVDGAPVSGAAGGALAQPREELR